MTRCPIVGVQYITYSDLHKAIYDWSLLIRDKKYRAVVGLPRSGLTVAHSLASILNIRATQIHAPEFRQATARPLYQKNGPYLVVDDCCSFGTAITHARGQLSNAEFGAVYARVLGSDNAKLNTWCKRHADIDWLVFTEWNLLHHQDCDKISVLDSVLIRDRVLARPASRRFDSLICVTGSPERVRHFLTSKGVPDQRFVDAAEGNLLDLFEQSQSSLLVVDSYYTDMSLFDGCSKSVLDIRTGKVTSPNLWYKSIGFFNCDSTKAGLLYSYFVKNGRKVHVLDKKAVESPYEITIELSESTLLDRDFFIDCSSVVDILSELPLCLR